MAGQGKGWHYALPLIRSMRPIETNAHPFLTLQKLWIRAAATLSIGTFNSTIFPSVPFVVLPGTSAMGFHDWVGSHPSVNFKLGDKVCVNIAGCVARLLTETSSSIFCPPGLWKR